MTKWKIVTIVGIVLLAVVWLLSGILFSDGDDAEATDSSVLEASDGTAELAKVRVIRSQSIPQSKALDLRGRTLIKDIVQVRAETSGQIVQEPPDIGSEVEVGDVLCKLEINDREARLEEAREALDLATLDYEASTRLSESGLQAKLLQARAQSQLASARRVLLSSEIELRNTSITAPVAGIIDVVHARVGDYVMLGSPCATILDLDPLYTEAYVSQDHVDEVSVGDRADIQLPNKNLLTGKVNYVSKVADEEMRTFRIEIELPNPEYAVRAGLNAEIRLFMNAYPAHKVPSSILVLNEQGMPGVKTVNTENRIGFYAVELIREEDDGMWVSGLPEVVTIVTVGQEYVAPGELVESQFENESI